MIQSHDVHPRTATYTEHNTIDRLSTWPTPKYVAEASYLTGDLVRVVFIQPGGKRQTASARVGESVMDCALDNAVDGIQAQCGGACTCCTCHVHVEPKWLPQLDAQHPDEAEMLEYAPGRAFNSRLSCQVVLSSDLDGLVVHICSES